MKQKSHSTEEAIRILRQAARRRKRYAGSTTSPSRPSIGGRRSMGAWNWPMRGVSKSWKRKMPN